jgi:hypothetical protein
METDQAWAASLRRTRHIGDFRAWKDHDQYQKSFDRLLRDLKAQGGGAATNLVAWPSRPWPDTGGRSCEKNWFSPQRRRDAEEGPFVFYPLRLRVSAVRSNLAILSQPRTPVPLRPDPLRSAPTNLMTLSRGRNDADRNCGSPRYRLPPSDEACFAAGEGIVCSRPAVVINRFS